MSDLEQAIIRVLGRDAGWTTGQIAQQVIELRDGTSYTRSARVRQVLLGLQKRGIVKTLDDLKPVAWVLA